MFLEQSEQNQTVKRVCIETEVAKKKRTEKWTEKARIAIALSRQKLLKKEHGKRQIANTITLGLGQWAIKAL